MLNILLRVSGVRSSRPLPALRDEPIAFIKALLASANLLMAAALRAG